MFIQYSSVYNYIYLTNKYKKSDYPNLNPIWKLESEFEFRSDLNKHLLFEPEFHYNNKILSYPILDAFEFGFGYPNPLTLLLPIDLLVTV